MPDHPFRCRSGGHTTKSNPTLHIPHSFKPLTSRNLRFGNLLTTTMCHCSSASIWPLVPSLSCRTSPLGCTSHHPTLVYDNCLQYHQACHHIHIFFIGSGPSLLDPTTSDVDTIVNGWIRTFQPQFFLDLMRRRGGVVASGRQLPSDCRNIREREKERNGCVESLYNAFKHYQYTISPKALVTSRKHEHVSTSKA